jgi:glutathionylspermidine synthase
MMERVALTPRENWTKEVEALGFDFYKTEGVPYWDESACWRFSADEIDAIEAAANALHRLCLQAVDRIVGRRLYPLLGIDPSLGDQIEESWKRKDSALYGRFDLIYDGTNPAKLIEYNADTPTSLFEAAVIQWNWKEQVFPKGDQFNSIHEALVDRWRRFRVGRRDADRLYVTCATPNPEDETTTQYIGAAAQEAGWSVKFIPIQDIGWDAGGRRFVDLDGEDMRNVFKLYPWEWMMKEDFGANIRPSGARFVEPMWKMLLSNKGLLPILWEMFPEHENLLPAFTTPGALQGRRMVRKAMLGREGANVRIAEGDKVIEETEGAYGEEGYVYQGFAAAPCVDGNYVQLGAWMIGDDCHGMGVREDTAMIMTNESRFVPHYFE